jgi:hypothetical protein
MTIDFNAQSDIQDDIRRIETIINTGIFKVDNSKHPLLKSAFIEVLICLRDLMYKTEKYDSRISFTDDIKITPKVYDISELIKFVRDALCHIDIANHFIPNTSIKSTFNIAHGKCNIMKIGNITISSDYEDDICFFFGEQKIYLKRHIIKALEETKQKLLPLMP